MTQNTMQNELFRLNFEKCGVWSITNSMIKMHAGMLIRNLNFQQKSVDQYKGMCALFEKERVEWGHPSIHSSIFFHLSNSGTGRTCSSILDFKPFSCEALVLVNGLQTHYCLILKVPHLCTIAEK